MAFDAGSVFVKLIGLFDQRDFDKFDKAVEREQVKSNTPIEQKLGADTTNLSRDLASADTKLQAWQSKRREANIGVNESGFMRTLASMASTLDLWATVNSKDINIKVDLDTTAAEAKLALLRGQLDDLRGSLDIGSSIGAPIQVPNLAGQRALPVPGTTVGGSNAPDGTVNRPFVVVVEAGRYATNLAGRSADLTYDSGYGSQDAQGPVGLGGGSTSQPIVASSPGQRNETAATNGLIRGLIEEIAKTHRDPAQAIPLGPTMPNWTGGPQHWIPGAEPQPQYGGGWQSTAAPGAGTRPWWVTNAPSSRTARNPATGRFSRGWWADPTVTGPPGESSAVPWMAATAAERNRPASTWGSRGGWWQTAGGMVAGDAATGGSGGGGGGGGGGFIPGVIAGGAGGGDGGGGGMGRGVGNFLFGAGTAMGGGWRFGGPLNPFQWGLHGPLGAVGGAVGLGPEHILSAGLSVLGSGVGALGGAGVIGLGAAGVAGVGMGVDAGMMKSTITDTQTLSQAYTALDQAVARYGANSNQAKDAQAQLNTQMALLGNTIGVKAEAQLARNAAAVNTYYDRISGPARVQAANILEQVVTLARTYTRPVVDAAQQNLTIINNSLKPLFAWLEGPQGMGIFNHLEDLFKRNLPTSIDALVNVIEAFLKTVNQAADFTGGFTQKLDDLARRWNNMPADELHAKMAKLVDDFHLWSDMIKNLGIDLYRLFHAGAGEGNELVAMFDNLLKRWGAWEKSAQGQQFLHTFFQNRKDELVAILQTIGPVLAMYGDFYKALQPLVPAVTTFAQIAANGMKNLAALVAPIADILGKVLGFFSNLGQQSHLFQDAFIVPLGAFLITWRRFGLDSAKNLVGMGSGFDKLKGYVGGVGEAMKSIFTGNFSEGMDKLKSTFSGDNPQSAPVTMEEAIVSGGQKAATTIGDAMIAAGEKVAGGIGGAEALGGGIAAAPITRTEAAAAGQMKLFGAETGGAATGQLGLESITPANAIEVGGAAGAAGILSRIRGIPRALRSRLQGGGWADFANVANPEAAVAEAGGASVLSRTLRSLGSGVRGVAGGLGRGIAARAGVALPAGILGATAAQLYGHATQTGNLLERVGAGAGVGAAGGAVAGVGFLDPITVPLGALAGAGAGLVSGLLGIGTPHISTAQRNLNDFVKQVQAIKNPADLSSGALHDLMNRATQLASEVPKAAGKLNTLWHQLNQIAQPKDAWNKGFNEAWRSVNKFVVDSSNSVKALKDRFDTNMRLIASTVGLESGTGQKLAEKNFDQLVKHVESAMQKGKIDVTQGMTLMRNAANSGTQKMRDDLTGHYAKIVKIIHDSWASGKTDTQTALTDLRNIQKTTYANIRQDINDAYAKQLQDAKNAHDQGLLTDQQYADKRKHIHKQMSTDIATAEFNLTKSSAGILSGLNSATTTGMDQLFKELNSALKALNVAQVTWTPIQKGAAQLNVGKLQQLIPHNAGGGKIPGANRFGLGDNMTLIDPTGRPIAKMAGDEAIFNRHQMPYVEAGLQMIGFNGSEELWNRVNTPNYYAGGGKIRNYDTGGYIYPFPNGTVIGRTDQGIDANMPVGAPIGPMGPARVVGRINNWYQGQPLVWWQLMGGPRAGRFAYVAEQITDIAPPGTMLKADQAVAHYAGSGTGIEYGWATAGGQTLARVTGGYNEGQVTPAGQDMRTFIAGLQHGRLLGGTFIGGAGGGAGWSTIPTPRLRGPGGPLNRIGQAALAKVTNAANQYGENQVGTGAYGTSVNLPGGVVNWIRQGMKLAGVAGPTWLQMLERQASRESGGNPNAVNNWDVNARHGDPSEGLLQTTISTFNEYKLPGHDNILNPIDNTAAAIRYMISTYGHGNAQTAAQVMWGRGGGAYAGGGYLPGYARGGGARYRKSRAEAAAARSRSIAHSTRTTAARPSGSGTGSYTGTGAGRAGGAPYSLYTPSMPRPTHGNTSYANRNTSSRSGRGSAKKAGNKNPPRLKQLSNLINAIPGLDYFAQDDADVAKLDTKYQMQDSIFQLADPGGYTLEDLDVLYGIRDQQWNILWGEYQALPGMLNNLYKAKVGTMNASGKGYHGGINQEIAHLTGLINKDEKTVTNLNNELYKDQQRAAGGRHGVTQAAINAAQGNMQQLAPFYDQLQANTDRAIALTKQIGAIPPPVSLHGLRGSQYGNAQQTNEANARLRTRLSTQRSTVLESNQGIRDKISRLNQEKTKLALQYRQQGFDIAWNYQLQRFRIGEKIRKLKAAITTLKQELAKETKLGTQYNTAIDDIYARLHGPTAAQPNATGVKDELSTYGMDILQLHNQGADVPQNVITDITNLLTSMGIQVPANISTGATPTTASAALQDFLNFQQDRSNMLAQFGSNFVAAGQNPFAGTAGIAAGTQYYGAASGPASGGNFARGGQLPGLAGGGFTPSGSAGDTYVNIEQHFGGPPPDAHTYSAGLRHEIGALV